MATMAIRSTIVTAARSTASRSRVSISPKPLSSLFSSSPTPLSSASRLVSALGISGSQKPLHSAIASARLTSVLALDSTCWCCLSQGFALPL